MTPLLTDGPLLWFLNRGTGVVLLVVLTASTLLGLLGAERNAGGRVPAFLPHEVHRNLSVLGLVLTGVHAVTAVVDSFVDIRWWQAFVPFGSAYEPLWLGLGALSFDLMLVVALTSALRRRLGHTAWHRVHLAGYAAWPIAFVHAAGIGTDAPASWARWLAAGCAAVLAVGLTARLRRHRRGARSRDPEGFVTLGAR